MLKSMQVTNFTVFRDEVFEFSPNLNIVIGENSVGKSHLLKLAYAMLAGSFESFNGPANTNIVSVHWGLDFARRLMGVFRPEALGGLVNLAAIQANPTAECTLGFAFANAAQNFGLHFGAGAQEYVEVLPQPQDRAACPPVYLPTRELLSIYPGFVSLYERYHLEFDQTWRDTCASLGGPLLKGDYAATSRKWLVLLEQAMGGTVELGKNGRFYLNRADGAKLEMHMVAEGHRKLAMVAQLIANGMINAGTCLFWDEPEANLNAKLIRVVAQVIVELGRHGVQVFIATHSLFLLRELEILLADASQPTVPVHYIGLAQGTDSATVTQGEHSADLAEIVVLDEHIDQAERYLALED
jgi:ABC-type transport system involved in cytochrome c biogenesis ATPase subunit